MPPLSKTALRKAKRKKAKEGGSALTTVGLAAPLAPTFVDALVPQSIVVRDDLEVEIEDQEDEAFNDSLMEMILSMIVASPESNKLTDDEIEIQCREIAEQYKGTMEANLKLHEPLYEDEIEDEPFMTEGEDGDEELEGDEFLNTRRKKAQIALNEHGERLSRKQRKELLRPQISQLKGIAVHPDVVESWDATAKEPGMLVALKSWPNTVNVPTHWNSKRRYLAGKRAIDRGQFKLPAHIADTKISEIRSALLQKEEDQTLRQKMRARARPKSHRMDIDYQTLHDAFFKYAVKPVMSGYGSLYYEGREQEMRFAKYQPGKMTDALKDALGVHTPNTPNPWLFNQQRYGPPPAYPGLRIPGVNCPIPAGAEYGYGVGGWGAPPVDGQGNPLWGDLGVATEEQAWDSGNWTTYLWGDMDPSGRRMDDDEEMEEESEHEEAPEPLHNIDPVVTSAVAANLGDGIETPSSMISGYTSTPSVGLSSGLHTPSTVDLRKGIESAQGGSLGVTPYKVLQQREVGIGAQRSQFFQSSTLYDVQGALTSAQEAESKATGGVVPPPSSTSGAAPPAGPPSSAIPKEPPRKKRKGFKF